MPKSIYRFIKEVINHFMRILVNTPDLRILGGVANHYLGLRKYWTEEVYYNKVGRRWYGIPGIILLPYDIIKFIVKLLMLNPDAVILNPSLGKKALLRDFLFLKISKLFRRKTILFIHGFDLNYAEGADKVWLSENFNSADLIFVLADEFRLLLQSWGVKVPIVLTTTKVDDQLIERFDIKEKANTGNLLFIARIERAKGVYIAIDAYNILKREFPELTMTIAGNGSELARVKKYIEEKCISGITVLGAISGEQLIETYTNAAISIFPTYYGEGMPTSVLEAMAFGMPVFTRKVGGLKDFFDSSRMGYITYSVEQEEFANAIKHYLNDPSLYKQVSMYNHNYAIEHFLASKVAIAIEREINNILI